MEPSCSFYVGQLLFLLNTTAVLYTAQEPGQTGYVCLWEKESLSHSTSVYKAAQT